MSKVPKYNLALIPISKSDEIIKIADQLAHLADKYVLGKDSLPHVTLYQFKTEEPAKDIWKRVSKAWKEKPIKLEFKEFSCTSRDNITSLVALMPNNRDKLHAMHGLIAQILDKPIKENFDPHLTLCSTKNKDYEKTVDAIKASYRSISDKFILSLGHCDEVGQFTRVILKV